MASVIRWDEASLGKVIGRHPNVVAEVDAAMRRIHQTANAMGSGFRTGLYHRDHQSPAVGNTQAAYGGDVRVMGNSVVGIVHTGNYAAMRDNAENNTLLKSMG